jgi:tripartite-type tricarboxylate transporter receptor subunit TctC
MRNGGANAVSSKSPEDFKTYIDAETAKWAKVIEQSDVRAD